MGPYSFTLTDEEAKLAASRSGLRTALMGRLTLAHAAPLAAFVLWLLFVTILALTGLMSRRAAEASLISAAIVFMGYRLASHVRLRRAQRRGGAAMAALQRAGEVNIVIDDLGFMVATGSGSRRMNFADCEDAEYAGRMLYIWPRRGEPMAIPGRALGNDEAAQRLLAFARARIGSARRRV